MAAFINTKRELYFGDAYFKQVCGDCGFDWRVHKKERSPYYAERGFSVSGMYSAYYSYFNGIDSDRYMSMDMYFFYALPCLNKRNYMQAYADKNNYELFFPEARQPETIVKCRNGLFFDAAGSQISSEAAVSLCKDVDSDCIVKPTIESGSGKGVELLDRKDVLVQLKRLGNDLIVQRKVKQHPAMARLNPTSLNSMRLLTYRGLDGRIHFMHNQSFLRIGGRGQIKDNVGAGGGAGLCLVKDSGVCGDVIVGHCTLEKGSMTHDHCAANFVVPGFEKCISFVKRLHLQIYYLDFCGWDIAIDVDGEPMFVELNVTPDIYGTQSVGGPMFGPYLDEVMERIKSVKKISISNDVNVFRPGYDYVSQVAGEPYWV